jgi:uncharacterized low-complexity protein
MANNTMITKPVAAAVGVAFVSSLAVSTTAVAADNPFEAADLDSGYLVAGGEKDKEGKCGEGKCGEGKKGEEGACGEKKHAEGACGEKGEEGACGEKKHAEGACGEKGKELAARRVKKASAVKASVVEKKLKTQAPMVTTAKQSMASALPTGQYR